MPPHPLTTVNPFNPNAMPYPDVMIKGLIEWQKQHFKDNGGIKEQRTEHASRILTSRLNAKRGGEPRRFLASFCVYVILPYFAVGVKRRV